MRPGVTPNGKDGSSMGWGLRRLVLGIFLILAASPGWARAQAAGDAAAKADATPLARYAPHEGLVTFIEFDGLDAHEAAWRAQPPTRCSMRPSWGHCSRTCSPSSSSRPRHRSLRATSSARSRRAHRQGFVVAVWGKDPEDLHMVFAIRGGGRPEIRRLFETMIHMGRPVQAEDAGEDKAGRKVHAHERGDLLLVREGRPRRDQPARRDPRRAGRQVAQRDRPPDAPGALEGRGGIPAGRDRVRRFHPDAARCRPRRSAWASTASSASSWSGASRATRCGP